MHLVEIPERNIVIHVPEDLSECNPEQYINMSSLIFKYQTNEITYDEFKTHAVYYLLNLQPSEGNPEHYEDKYANISQLAELIDSFFEENEEGKKQIKQYYIHNPIQKVSNGLRSLHGPSEAFENISFGEYVDGLNHYEDFHQTKELQYLHYLMATFYRKPKAFLFFRKLGYNYNGDTRKPYNPDNLDRIADKLKPYPIGVFYGFYLLFASFQKYLTNASFWIQGKEIKLEILYRNSPSDKQPKSDIPGIGLRSILYTMAESGVFGTLEEVRNTSVYEILIRMYDMRKRDLDAKAKSKK